MANRFKFGFNVHFGGIFVHRRSVNFCLWVQINRSHQSIFFRMLTEVVAIFGIVRNQFAWYADDLVNGFMHMWVHFTMALIVIEYAPKQLEGTSFAFLFCVSSSSGSLGLKRWIWFLPSYQRWCVCVCVCVCVGGG